MQVGRLLDDLHLQYIILKSLDEGEGFIYSYIGVNSLSHNFTQFPHGHWMLFKTTPSPFLEDTHGLLLRHSVLAAFTYTIRIQPGTPFAHRWGEESESKVSFPRTQHQGIELRTLHTLHITLSHHMTNADWNYFSELKSRI